MPASYTSIAKNVERMTDPQLIELWNVETKREGRTPVTAWTAFIAAADAAHIADRIPGSVGVSFKRRYAATAPAEKPKPAPAKKTTTRKAPAKEAGK